MDIHPSDEQDLFDYAMRNNLALLNDWPLSSAIKYLWRLNQKDKAVRDAKKAVDYLALWVDAYNLKGFRGATSLEKVRELWFELACDFDFRDSSNA